MSDETHLESIHRIRMEFNEIVKMMEEDYKQKERNKNEQIQKLNKQINKFCTNSVQQFTSGYSVEWLKQVLQGLLEIIKDQDKRLEELEK
jgi:phage host-nuclease inhibitor protein Gam